MKKKPLKSTELEYFQTGGVPIFYPNLDVESFTTPPKTIGVLIKSYPTPMNVSGTVADAEVRLYRFNSSNGVSMDLYYKTGDYLQGPLMSSEHHPKYLPENIREQFKRLNEE